jgi:hypothetical protein
MALMTGFRTGNHMSFRAALMDFEHPRAPVNGYGRHLDSDVASCSHLSLVVGELCVRQIRRCVMGCSRISHERPAGGMMAKEVRLEHRGYVIHVAVIEEPTKQVYQVEIGHEKQDRFLTALPGFTQEFSRVDANRSSVAVKDRAEALIDRHLGVGKPRRPVRAAS